MAGAIKNIKKIAIIGAGPSGLVAAKYVRKALRGYPEPCMLIDDQISLSRKGL